MIGKIIIRYGNIAATVFYIQQAVMITTGGIVGWAIGKSTVINPYVLTTVNLERIFFINVTISKGQIAHNDVIALGDFYAEAIQPGVRIQSDYGDISSALDGNF
jgi:hypothetical protein